MSMDHPSNRNADVGVISDSEPISVSLSSHPQSPSTPPPENGGLRSRYDQTALGSGSTGYASSISHACTSVTAYSNMEIERQGHGNNAPVHDDTESVYSYNSTRDVSRFVKELHGRIFNNLSGSYLLPSDQAEWARLDKQGSALAIAFDGLYPCQDTVEAVLVSEEGKTKRILDVGCGTGAWALQMAVKFPHVSILGVDVAPTPIDQASFPPNLSLEIDDITLGMSHFENTMDLVHMRCVAGGIRDMDKTLQELQLCLKPGGLLLVVDGDNGILREDRKTVVPLMRLPGDGRPEVTGVSEQGSWFRRLFWEAGEACEVAGACLTRTRELYDLGLWEQPLCDPETARSGGVDLPIGPWATSEDPEETRLLQYVGVLMRQNALNVHRAYHAILLKHGMAQATLDDWSNQVDEELKRMKPKMWVRFRFIMARRRAGEGLPAPPLLVLSSAKAEPPSEAHHDTSMESHHGKPQGRPTGHARYPAIDIYSTKEENFQWLCRRRATFGVPPPSILRNAWAKKQAGSCVT